MTDQFVAEIRMFATNFAPTGWATCDGQVLPISQNTALFSLLGTFYGGDGKVNFALPNLQGNVPIGAGQGPGLSDRFLGEMDGLASVTLIASEMPQHQHGLQASAAVADRPDPEGAVLAASADETAYLTATPDTALAADSLAPTGGNLPHNNLMPYLTVNFCIALSGIYPPRS